MSKDYNKELNDIYRLMYYGLNENKTNEDTKSNGILEYYQLGADGKTYGIVREGTKYYIKVAPKKHTKILLEDYDYLGGFNNRKSFNSYNKASQELNLKLISVNESMGGIKPVESQFNLNESAEWSTNTTKEARADLNRFYELVSNVDKLLSENVHYIKENKNTPYTENGKANYNSKNGGGNKGTAGSPDQNLGIKDKTFVDGDNTTRPNKSQSDYQDAKGIFKIGKEHGFGDHNIGEDEGNAYQEKPTKMKNESKRCIKLSEEQAERLTKWKRAFVHDSSNNELNQSYKNEIGDTDPYTININEKEGDSAAQWKRDFVHKSSDSELDRTCGTEIGDTDPYTMPINENEGGMNISLNDILNGTLSITHDGQVLRGGENNVNENLEFDDNQFYNDGDMDVQSFDGSIMDDDDILDDDMYGDEFDELSTSDEDILSNIPEDDYNDDMDGDELLFEVTLNDFGKHPAYRKKPMTLPQTGDDSKWGRDWNDDSVKSEKPFGSQIGHGGDLFNQKVDAIANAIVDVLTNSKKKI